MTAKHPTDVVWRKSSRSNGDGNVCVEIALLPGQAAMRDSKNPVRAALVISARAWKLFHRALLEFDPGAVFISPFVTKERPRDD